MDLGATMELGDGRGGQLEEEDTLFIVMGQFQLLPTNLARDPRYYHTTGAVLPHGPAVLPRRTAVLPLPRQGLGPVRKR